MVPTKSIYGEKKNNKTTYTKIWNVSHYAFKKMNIAFNCFNEIKSGNRTSVQTLRWKKTVYNNNFHAKRPTFFFFLLRPPLFPILFVCSSFTLLWPCSSFKVLNVNKIMNVYSNSIVWLLSCYYFNFETSSGNRTLRQLWVCVSVRPFVCMCLCVFVRVSYLLFLNVHYPCVFGVYPFTYDDDDDGWWETEWIQRSTCWWGLFDWKSCAH